MSGSLARPSAACCAAFSLVIPTFGLASAPPPPAARILTFEDGGYPHIAGADSGLKGLLIGSPAAKVRMPTVYVSGLRPGDKTVCLAIERATGSYWAKITVDVADLGGRGQVAIPFARYINARGQFRTVPGAPAAQLAVLAQASGVANARGCSPDAPVLPAAWQADADGALIAQVQSPDAEAYVSVDPKGAVRNCGELGAVAPMQGLPTVFDTACVLPRPKCGAVISMVVSRNDRRTSRPLSDISASLRAPC